MIPSSCHKICIILNPVITVQEDDILHFIPHHDEQTWLVVFIRNDKKWKNWCISPDGWYIDWVMRCALAELRQYAYKMETPSGNWALKKYRSKEEVFYPMERAPFYYDMLVLDKVADWNESVSCRELPPLTCYRCDYRLLFIKQTYHEGKLFQRAFELNRRHRYI